MKKAAGWIFALQLLTATIALGQPLPSSECTICGGVVSDMTVSPPVEVPLLLSPRFEDLGGVAGYLAPMTAAQKKKTTVMITVALDELDDAIPKVEGRVQNIVEWATANGPFKSLGLRVTGVDATVEGYAIKRLAVTAQGLNLADNVIAGPMTLSRLEEIYQTGAEAYFDELITEGAVAETVAWIVERDPSKRVSAIVPAEAANPAWDIASALSSGAIKAWVEAPNEEPLFRSINAVNRQLAGDFSPDPSAAIRLLSREGTPIEGDVLAFVRGEDLRVVAIPPGSRTDWSIVSFPDDSLVQPARADAGGINPITDAGRRGGNFLIGIPPADTAFSISVDRPAITDDSVTRETVEVSTERTLSVEEIIRNHQAYHAYQETIEPRYIARNETDLRFAIGPGGETVETTIAGEFYFDPSGRSDWVWQEFLVNGVKWKYGRLPEVPIIQAEKVSQLPLNLHLTNDYRYQLVRRAPFRGFDAYEVRFEPPPNAPADLPMYRGTVWIDSRTWARLRIAMVQLNLRDEVLSNEERIDFAAFRRDDHASLSVEQIASTPAANLIWLPVDVSGQQVISAAGRATPVSRSTTFTNFEINPANFDERHASVSASEARMVRDTERGLRYLERKADGTRVVKEGTDTSSVFLLGGLNHDAGLEFPVLPIGGLDYFNFNIKGTGLQTNVFFAGVILAANLTDPSFGGTRANLGADFFGLAIPFENISYRDGEEVVGEAVRALPLSLTLRAGHPVFGFGKVDLSLDISHISYQRAEETDAAFIIPSNTYVFTPALSARYDRWGYSLATNIELGSRSTWEPWGYLDEYSDEHEEYTRYSATLGKSIHLPNFQRVGLELNYLDGNDLDRFSKYELGPFGAMRVRGISSGSVRAEKAVLGHISYGLVFSQQFRLEAFYDHALIDDEIAGYRREPFQGIGIGGQTIGPFGTILRIDLGKSVGRNSQDDFTATVIFLKLLG